MAQPVRISFGRGFDIRIAHKGDLRAILRMRKSLSVWLHGKNLDQWQRPWPSEKVQTERILAAIQAHATWIVSRGKRRVATLTVHERDQGELWSRTEGGGIPALYLSRMMVDRFYAGRGIGMEMLLWAENYAAAMGLRYLRLDAWTDNEALHRYYLERGFESAGEIPESLIAERPELAAYPSKALFQRKVRTPVVLSSGRTAFSPLTRRGFEWVNTG